MDPISLTTAQGLKNAGYIAVSDFSYYKATAKADAILVKSALSSDKTNLIPAPNASELAADLLPKMKTLSDGRGRVFVWMDENKTFVGKFMSGQGQSGVELSFNSLDEVFGELLLNLLK